MVVSKVKYGNCITLTGTVAEVAQAISDEQVPEKKFTIFYNGANITAIWKIL
jgi:hypothetical protein